VELAQRLAAKLGVPLKMIPHETAGLYAESLKTGGWDLVMSGRDPTRAEFVVFSDPYLEIESLYLARPGLDLESADQVDRAGTRIVVISGGSQDNYLSRSLKQATLVRVKNGAEAKEALLSGRADVLGATGPGVYALAAEVAGSNVLAGRFSIVEQTIGLPKRNADLLTYIGEFLRDAKESGFVADQIRRAGLKGVRPAP
jgi:polar amino acid transport system substrate-binding protein